MSSLRMPEISGAIAVHLPGVHVLVAGDVDLFEHGGRDVDDSGDGGPEAIDVLLGETDLNAGFGSADLLGGAAGKDADECRCPTGRRCSESPG
jgi:hypothetical protein